MKHESSEKKLIDNDDKTDFFDFFSKESMQTRAW